MSRSGSKACANILQDKCAKVHSDGMYTVYMKGIQGVYKGIQGVYKGHTRGIQGVYKGHTRGIQGVYKGYTSVYL